MNKLIEKIKELENSPVSKIVNKRLREFKKLGKGGNDYWFSELCFCILTANSKASTALEIQKELGANGFLHITEKSLQKCIKRNKHRFHNNKAKYIIEARKFQRIKDVLKKENEPREWLVKNIKGIGWKESSHLLRNVGYTGYAILDRHIINLLYEQNYIKKKPTLKREVYINIEKKFRNIACKLDMSPAELDLYMWYIKTGKVLK